MRSLIMLEPAVWSEKQFDACEFGDTRSTQRLVLYVQQMAEKPDASTPHQTENQGDRNAMYRLPERPEDTFESVTAAYDPNTQTLPPGIYLVVSDTTEIDDGYESKRKGLGPPEWVKVPWENHTSSANDQNHGRIYENSD